MASLSLQQIKENISNARKTAGITQEDMAKSLGITQPAYSYYETGEKPIPLNKIKTISEILSIPAKSLLGDDIFNDSDEVINSINKNLERIADTLDKLYNLFQDKKHIT
jgi:transcriptional regulator with XRE-family HTH domain